MAAVSGAQLLTKFLAQPAIFATVAAAGLIAIALPFFSLNLGFNEGADALPDALESKRTLQLLEDHFSSSLTRPAWIVIDAPNVNSPDVEAATTKLIETLDSDTSFFGPFETQVNRDEDLMLIRVPVAGKIDDEVSVNAVKLLRNDILPIAFSGTTVRAALVAGATAESIDFEGQDARLGCIRIRFRVGACVSSDAGHVPLSCHSDKGNRSQSALRRRGLRCAGDGIPVGLGNKYPWL